MPFQSWCVNEQKSPGHASSCREHGGIFVPLVNYINFSLHQYGHVGLLTKFSVCSGDHHLYPGLSEIASNFSDAACLSVLPVLVLKW